MFASFSMMLSSASGNTTGVLRISKFSSIQIDQSLCLNFGPGIDTKIILNCCETFFDGLPPSVAVIII